MPAPGTGTAPVFFRFDAAATVVGIAPHAGPAQGGTTVVVTGSGFAERLEIC